MNYKISIKDRLNAKKLLLTEKEIDVRIASLNPKDTAYSIDDENLIMKMRSEGKTYRQIAKKLNRSYWGVVDKIRRIKM